MTTSERQNEIEYDLEITRILFKKSKSAAYRKAINKLRYLLIVEKNKLTHDNGHDY